jgi:glycosyltransferase involved in cell wall biosynthesis
MEIPVAPDPLVSVIVPAYNRSAAITDSLGSALRQDYERLELIVVDDCSKDDTAAIVAAIPDKRVRLLRHEKNGGASAARNTGIAAATGQIIAFLDSDDSWFPTKISRNIEFMREHRLDPAERWTAYNRVQIKTELGSQMSRRPAKRELTVAELLFCNCGAVQTSGVFLPAALAKEVRFSEDVHWVDDWDFLLKLESAGALLHFQDEVLTVHNAYSAATRVSNAVNADSLVRWIEGRRASLSHREITGFYANRVASQYILSGRRLKGLQLLAEGVAANVASPRTLAVELARVVVPEPAFRSLRRHLGRSR